MNTIKQTLKTYPLLWFVPIIIALALIVAVVSYVTTDHTRYAAGTVEATHIDIAAKIPARIKTFRVEEGDSVAAGDTLLLFENREIGAKVGQARAALGAAEARYAMVMHGARKEEVAMAEKTYRQADWGMEVMKKTYDRMKPLHDQGVISSQQWDEVDFKYRAAVEQRDAAYERYIMVRSGTRIEEKDAASSLALQARNAVAEAESYYDETSLRAPVHGIVEKCIADPGELISAGYPLLTIVDPAKWWVVANIEERAVGALHVGDVLECVVPSRGNARIPFRVARVSVLADFATRKATNETNNFDMRTFEVKLVPAGSVDPVFEGSTVLVPLQN
jgi:HlyD family secretion protein